MEELLQNLLGEFSTTFFGSLLVKAAPLILLILISNFIIKFIMKFAKKMIENSKLPKTSHTIATYTIRVILYFFVIMIICATYNIDVTSLIAAFSIVGVAFSLSLQDSLSNVMSGITLLFTKQFAVDNFIEAGGVSGTVMNIGLSHCKLKTPDNKEIYVPNSTIVSEKIINYSNQPNRRVDLTIGVSYNEDIDKVKKALQSVIDDTPEVLRDQDIFVGITAYKDSCIDYTIRVWTKNSDYWKAYLPMLEKVKRTFDKENIEIPYNKLDVTILNK